MTNYLDCLKFGLVLSGVVALLGCSASSEDEVRQWMAEQRKQTQPKIAPITEPKQFKPEAYVQTSSLEPFSKEKLTDRKSTRLNSSHSTLSRMPSSA